LRATECYTGNLRTRCALKLAPFTFVRPGELRHASGFRWRCTVEPIIYALPESRPVFFAALAIPDLEALIFSVYWCGIRVDFHPPDTVSWGDELGDAKSARACAPGWR
jgi:hypothetical protein